MGKVSNHETWWQGFGFTNLEPEEFKKRTSAVNAAILTILAGLVHSVIYTVLGFPYVTIAVVSYAIFSIGNLIYLRLSHSFNTFRNIQLLLISFSPFLTQLFIGGFINGSAVAIAGFIAPATALLYTSGKRARGHYYLFAALIVIAVIWDVYIADRKIILPVYIITTFFAVNLISTLGIIYFLMESFLKKQEELRRELSQSLEHLKSTQAQLIQSEKMASLGELTAGVAHEIQNPLNFVNNFSEVNNDLMDELIAELNSTNNSTLQQIINDIKENNARIVQHGKRADAIVKGMLQHSRQTKGTKEPTDINALCDEYLRLSYHGLQAKDKHPAVSLTTDFDSKVGQINIVRQDIGRVLVNLFNNSFYAVSKKEPAGSYHPSVILITKKIRDKIEITIRDNGNGIPSNIIDKIFQPFFTTKPTGQGTGLGLSLAYDIITKEHNGRIRVESKEGEGATFTITLPAA